MSEFSPPVPDNGEVPEDFSKPKRRNYWRNLFRRDRDQELIPETEAREEAEEDDDDDESPAERKGAKRFTRRLRRIWGSIVPPPIVAKVSEKPEKPEKPPAALLETPLAAANQEVADSGQPDAAEAPEIASNREEQPAAAPETAHQPEMEPDAETPEEPAGLERSAVVGAEQAVPPRYPPPLERVVFERAAEQPPAVETYGRNVAGLATIGAVGVVAETIGRRRADKRIRKEEKKDVANLQQQIKQDRTRTTRLEQAAAKAPSPERSPQLIAWQQAFEARIPGAAAAAAQSAEKTPTIRQSRQSVVSERFHQPERPRPVEKPQKPEKQRLSKEVSKEKAPSTAAIRQERPPVSERITQEKAPATARIETATKVAASETARKPIENTPAVALATEKQIEAVIGKKIELESYYEGKQAIKDAQTVPRAGKKPAGAATTSSPSVTSAAVHTAQPGDDADQKRARSLANIPKPYRQAVQSGFWTAVVFLAILVVAAVIR